MWMRVSSLNFLYYHPNALKVIAVGIGRLVHADLITKQVRRGKYVWIYVEVDLKLPIAQKLWIHDH